MLKTPEERMAGKEEVGGGGSPLTLRSEGPSHSPAPTEH